MLAMELRYPGTPLAVGIKVHMAARTLVVQKEAALPVLPTTSIGAGCMQSVPWVRTYLYQLLEDLHSEYMPVTKVQTWIDDMRQKSIGPKEVAKVSVSRAANQLTDGLGKLGCKVAPKSILRCTSKNLREQVLAGLKVKVSHSPTVRDLGIDSGCGRQRRLPTFKARQAKGYHRLRAIKKIIKVDKRGRKLLHTGAKPQLTWGHTARGMAPTTL